MSIERQDRVLLAGLVLALILVFARPLRYLPDLAREVERTSSLALVSALLILTIVILVHQQAKRQEAKARAAAAEAEASNAGARADETERLVAFGQALGRSLDLDAIRDVVQRHLPKLTGTDDAWVMGYRDGHWQALAGASRDGRRESTQVRMSIADRALAGTEQRGWAAHPIDTDGHMCLPMVAGGQAVGVVGIPEAAGPFDEGRRRARRSQMPVSLIMFDLDHFKDINDRHGHLCGDAVLAGVGARMRDVLRGSDLKCRYGGEEFLVLLPETPLEGARRVADTLRLGIGDMGIAWKDEAVMVTASFGVTASLPSEIDPETLIARADAALYRAKEQGRNCVRVLVESAVA